MSRVDQSHILRFKVWCNIYNTAIMFVLWTKTFLLFTLPTETHVPDLLCGNEVLLDLFRGLFLAAFAAARNCSNSIVKAWCFSSCCWHWFCKSPTRFYNKINTTWLLYIIYINLKMKWSWKEAEQIYFLDNNQKLETLFKPEMDHLD